MARFEDTIEVEVPVRVGYDQWTQFREFPKFMEGVESVELLDSMTLRWVATSGGRQRTWTARIIERTPDVRIAWQSIDGGANDGTVLFRSLGLDRTLVTLRLDVQSDGPMEAAGTTPASMERQVRGDLRRFKAFVEEKLVPTGPLWGPGQAGRDGPRRSHARMGH